MMVMCKYYFSGVMVSIFIFLHSVFSTNRDIYTLSICTYAITSGKYFIFNCIFLDFCNRYVVDICFTLTLLRIYMAGPWSIASTNFKFFILKLMVFSS